MKSLIFAAAAVAGLSGGAEAATLTATEVLNQFNLVTTGDVTGSSGFHIDGRALVGGNYAVQPGSVVYMNAKGTASTFDDMIVAGNVAAQVHLNNGGTAAVGSGGANINLNGGGSVSSYNTASAPLAYPAILSSYAASLAALAPSASGVTRQGNQFDRTNSYSVSGVANGVGVIALTEADFRPDRDFMVSLATGVEWVVVNVAATATDKVFSLGSTFKAQQAASTASKIIWNFVGFTDVVFDAQFSAGAILADGAKVTSTGGNIEGSVFAKSFHSLSELHYVGLNAGSLPGDGGFDAPPAVPLPATMPLLVGALGLVAFARRRKSA